MSQPGWYPDPSGQPGFRWWDGRTWTQQTTQNPSLGPGGPTGPTGPSGNHPGGNQFGGQPSGGSQPGGNGERKRNPGPLIAIIAGALVLILVLALLLPRLFNRGSEVTTDPPTPTVSGWDETSSPSPTPTPTPTPTPDQSKSPTPSAAGSPSGTAQEATACPTGDPTARAEHPNDGLVHGGGLAYSPVADWQPYNFYGLSWGYDVTGQMWEYNPTWISIAAVGALRVGDGFTDPKQAAEAMMQCLASSAYYQDFASRKDIWSKEVTVDGHKGYSIRSEIRIDPPNGNAEGDVAEVIVVDTGNPESFGFFTSSATIGDTERQKLVDAAAKSLTVD